LKDRTGETWEVHGVLHTISGPPERRRGDEAGWLRHPAFETEGGSRDMTAVIEADGGETLEGLAERWPDVYRRVG
jgi:hypothetical protein